MGSPYSIRVWQDDFGFHVLGWWCHQQGLYAEGNSFAEVLNKLNEAWCV